MANTTTIVLQHKEEKREFGITHAERLLDYQAKKGFNDWQIADDQPYKYEDGSINPTGTGTNKNTAKQLGDK